MRVTYLQKSITKIVAKVKSTEVCWCVGVDTKVLEMDHQLVSCSKWWVASFHAGEGEIEFLSNLSCVEEWIFLKCLSLFCIIPFDKYKCHSAILLAGLKFGVMPRIMEKQKNAERNLNYNSQISLYRVHLSWIYQLWLNEWGTYGCLGGPHKFLHATYQHHESHLLYKSCYTIIWIQC